MHDIELIQSVACVKHCLPFVALGDPDGIIGSMQVEPSEDTCGAQTVKEIGNEG